jgi:hypothetical protein
MCLSTFDGHALEGIDMLEAWKSCYCEDTYKLTVSVAHDNSVLPSMLSCPRCDWRIVKEKEDQAGPINPVEQR